MKKYFIQILILFLFPIWASAASFGLSKSVIPVGSDAEVSVFLDTQGKNINAIEAEISLPEGLKASEVFDAETFFVWVSKPEFRDGKIRLEGFIPGGFSGMDAPLIRFILNAEEEREYFLSVDSLVYFENDGLGKGVSVPSFILPIASSRYISTSTTASDRTDHRSPEEFKILLGQDKDVYDGKHFISFRSSDLGSGISYYEVLEVPRGNFWKKPKYDSVWQKTDSPYVLKDQRLNSDVYVKAVDRKGNFIIIKADVPMTESVGWRLYVIYGVVLICLMGIAVFFKMRK